MRSLLFVRENPHTHDDCCGCDMHVYSDPFSDGWSERVADSASCVELSMSLAQSETSDSETDELPAGKASRKLVQSIVRVAMSSLDEQSQVLLSMRFGLGGYPVVEPTALAVKFGINPRETEELIQEGLGKLRKVFRRYNAKALFAGILKNRE